MKHALAAALSVAAIAALPAHATEWQFRPSATAGADYIDNPRLIPNFGESYSGYRADVTFDLSANTEVSAISLVPRYVYARYPADPLLDRRDTHVTLNAQRVFETVSWNAASTYMRDTTITSELGLTDLQHVNREHEALSLSLGPTVQFSERAQAGVQVYGLDTRYEDAERTGLFDYQYGLAALNGEYVLTQTVKVGMQASVGQLDVESTASRSRDIDGTVSIDWSFAPQWQAQLEVGPTRVESDFEDSQGEIYSASLSKENVRSNYRLAIERDVTPTGRGVLVTRERVTLSGAYDVTETARLILTAHGVRTTDALQVAGVRSQTNRYASMDGSLQWRIAEYWSVVASATARYADYEFRADAAEGFNISVGLIWNGQPRTLSR